MKIIPKKKLSVGISLFVASVLITGCSSTNANLKVQNTETVNVKDKVQKKLKNTEPVKVKKVESYKMLNFDEFINMFAYSVPDSKYKEYKLLILKETYSHSPLAAIRIFNLSSTFAKLEIIYHMQKFAHDNNFYEKRFKLNGKNVNSSFFRTDIKNFLLKDEILRLINSLIVVNQSFAVSEDNLENYAVSYNMMNKLFKNMERIKTVINDFTGYDENYFDALKSYDRLTEYEKSLVRRSQISENTKK